MLGREVHQQLQEKRRDEKETKGLPQFHILDWMRPSRCQPRVRKIYDL